MPTISVPAGVRDMSALIKVLFPPGSIIRHEGSGSRPRARDSRGGSAALPAAAGPGEAPADAAAAGLRMEDNQQLGPGTLVVGVEVLGARRPGGPALADVTRNAAFVGNRRGNLPTAPAPEGHMVVGARFHAGAEGEAIAGIFRDNRNYGRGGMNVGYLFG